MLLKKITIENVRSFLDRREMEFDGIMSIIIGPNGGGKTNFLDVLNTIFRRYLFATRYIVKTTDSNNQEWSSLQNNDHLNGMQLEKHSNALSKSQYVAIEVEVSQADIDNMRTIKNEYQEILDSLRHRFIDNPWNEIREWNIESISSGMRFVYEWKGGMSIEVPVGIPEKNFLSYLRIFELDNELRAEAGRDPLKLSMIYLPVNRTAHGFQSSIGLANYNDYDQKRSIDAVTSRGGGNIMSLAVGRLAKKYRELQEKNNINAKKKFYSDKNIISLSKILKEIGYSWELVCSNHMNNTFDIKIQKQGTSFLVSAASSGEREILTYLFAIFALNVRDALIIVDEPELHLHPRWQKTLYGLFHRLAMDTGNQFVLATHSPIFISPNSIQYVSRIHVDNQCSHITRLNLAHLPNAKSLFNMVNSQNNEKIFFADKVVLVEGISDAIFFEKLFNVIADQKSDLRASSMEIVSVGGKGFFQAYEGLLRACRVNYAIIADLDYIEQIGTSDIKSLFRVNEKEIKDDVINNSKSIDAKTLVAHVDNAIENGSWSDAKEVWDYIKSRHRRLSEYLRDDQREKLTKYIDDLKNRNIYLLSKGALEDYLPDNYKRKDLGVLIEFVQSENFIANIPDDARKEVEKIAGCIMG